MVLRVSGPIYSKLSQRRGSWPFRTIPRVLFGRLNYWKRTEDFIARPMRFNLRAGAKWLLTPRKPDLGWPSDLGKLHTNTEWWNEISTTSRFRFLILTMMLAIMECSLGAVFNEISNEIRDSFPLFHLLRSILGTQTAGSAICPLHRLGNTRLMK